jgi:hypothetical protein
MKLRVLWVDDEVVFGDQAAYGKNAPWPGFMIEMLHRDAIPDEKGDGGFPLVRRSDGALFPATYLDLYYARSFLKARDLIRSRPFDLAILDVRLREDANARDEFTQFLEEEGLPTIGDLQEKWGVGVPAVRTFVGPLVEMMTSFWLWRELARNNPATGDTPATTVFFYTNYGDEPAILPYSPFMNPHFPMPLAIYGKAMLVELDKHVRDLLDVRAAGTLSRLSYAELHRLKSDLMDADDQGSVIEILQRSILPVSPSMSSEVVCSDIFPELALDCHKRSPDRMRLAKAQALKVIDRVVSKYQVCRVLARLHMARNLDWGSEQPYGLELVGEFLPNAVSTAWQLSGLAPLELVSHAPTGKPEPRDLQVWKECLTKAGEQIDSLRALLPKQDLALLYELLKACQAIGEPSEEQPMGQINRIKGQLRWNAAEVFGDNPRMPEDKQPVAGVVSGFPSVCRPPLRKSLAVAGAWLRIRNAIQDFVLDLHENRGVGEVRFAYSGDDHPCVPWMAVWGEGDGRQWPFDAHAGNKIKSGCASLMGTLACYQLRLERGDFDADLLARSFQLSHPTDELKRIRECMEATRPQSETLIGFAFVLQGYTR